MKDQRIVESILEKMFVIAGQPKTFAQILAMSDADPEWYSNNTMTKKQNEKWIEWGIKFIRKKLKYPKIWATKEMMYINMMWGLREKN